MTQSDTQEVKDTPEDMADSVRVSVHNIGGISDCKVRFSRGVTVLSGQNATNRTSLLTALVDVLGGDMATLKSDKDEGEVKLELDSQTFTRKYARQGNTVATSGTPLSDNSTLVNLFVGLIEQNAARRAVERDDDLRDVIMKPVDTEKIQQEIKQLEREREHIDQELTAIEQDRNRLPDLEERRRELAEEIQDVTAELEEVREIVEEQDASEAEAEEAESLIEELDALRQNRTAVEQEIDTQHTSIEALRDERDEVSNELDDITVDDSDLEELEREIDRLQTRKRELEDTISDLSAIVEVNDDFVRSNRTPFSDVEGETASPTSALDPMSQEVECWTCGSHVQRQAIAERLDELQQVIDEKREKHRTVAEELDEIEDRQADIKSLSRRQAELQSRLQEIERQIERREEKIESLQQDKEDIQHDLEALETRLEETEELGDSELVEHYQRLSDLEYKRGQLEQQLSDIEAEIDEIEERSEERTQLEAQRNEIQDEIASLRSRIDELEQSAIERFNDHMADILDLLEYQNLDRVWIDRRKNTSGPGEPITTFELHVVRESEAGSAYEDTIDTLSESEREIIGLVVALSGYLVHDVHEEVPFMLLDSLEVIDAERINKLVDYFSDYAPYLVVALLPEDAEVIQTDATQIRADSIGS